MYINKYIFHAHLYINTRSYIPQKVSNIFNRMYIQIYVIYCIYTYMYVYLYTPAIWGESVNLYNMCTLQCT